LNPAMGTHSLLWGHIRRSSQTQQKDPRPVCVSMPLVSMRYQKQQQKHLLPRGKAWPGTGTNLARPGPMGHVMQSLLISCINSVFITSQSKVNQFEM